MIWYVWYLISYILGEHSFTFNPVWWEINDVTHQKLVYCVYLRPDGDDFPGQFDVCVAPAHFQLFYS